MHFVSREAGRAAQRAPLRRVLLPLPTLSAAVYLRLPVGMGVGVGVDVGVGVGGMHLCLCYGVTKFCQQSI